MLTALVIVIVGYILMGSFTLEGLRTTDEWWKGKNPIDTSKVTRGNLLGLVLVSFWYCYFVSIREFVRFLSCALVYALIKIYI